MAQDKELKVIARKGDDVKVECPIIGNPAPIIEWQKVKDHFDLSVSLSAYLSIYLYIYLLIYLSIQQSYRLYM